MSAMVSTNYKNFTGEVVIGHCAVDSGQLMITDPCYVDQWLDETRTEGGEWNGRLTPNEDGSYPYSYNGACSATLSNKSAGQLSGGLGIAFSTGGDGEFSVVAEYQNGVIVSIKIEMCDPRVPCSGCDQLFEECLCCGYCDEKIGYGCTHFDSDYNYIGEETKEEEDSQ